MNNGHPLPWTANEILKATGGELLCGNKEKRFAAVSIDSRNITADDVFVAIVGDVHDGHSFIDHVLKQGVVGMVVNRQKAADLPIATWQTQNVACVAVADTTRALGDLAAFDR